MTTLYLCKDCEQLKMSGNFITDKELKVSEETGKIYCYNCKEYTDTTTEEGGTMSRDYTPEEAVEEVRKLLHLKEDADWSIVARYEKHNKNWEQYIITCDEMGLDQGSASGFIHCVHLIKEQREGR